jgi:hypothetical protein
MRQKISLAATALSVLVAIISALSMRDHVRLVDIVGLFASGVGTGASIASAMVGRARRAEGETA